MKRKTMRNLFILLFVIGAVVGYLLPGDFKDLTRKPLRADIFDVPKKMAQLDLETDYFKYSVLAGTETGSVELIRLDEKIPLHMHPKENHFVFVYKGRAKGTVGDVNAEVGPGQLVAIPAGVPHSFERVGDAPVEIILFSTPPFTPGDTVFLEKE
ncbi:cupin domain-containing protein [Candidatus Woesearchaeota archaeon]|nr:cupin domain-containing protein [Candidatus Woesearchaeota archaeon]